MGQEQTARKLLGAQVEEALMAYIIGTPIAVGEKLPNEFALGQQFQVGRSTIREAVKSLATKGILEVRRGDGTYVKSHCSLAEDGPCAMRWSSSAWPGRITRPRILPSTPALPAAAKIA